MNKFIKMTMLSLSLSCTSVLAYTGAAEINDAKNIENIATSNTHKLELMSKLKGIEQFSALFKQTIVDNQGNVLQQGGGDISVKRPNLVRWNTTEPDESLIVSDGESIFLFDPFIEQVTAYKLDGAIANTPILLITSDSTTLWDQYSVGKISDNNYVIHANNQESRVKTLEIVFNQNNQLSGFTFLDSTGQLSKVSLDNVDFSSAIAPSLFKFIMPEGVHLDDQR